MDGWDVVDGPEDVVGVGFEVSVLRRIDERSLLVEDHGAPGTELPGCPVVDGPVLDGPVVDGGAVFGGVGPGVGGTGGATPGPGGCVPETDGACGGDGGVVTSWYAATATPLPTSTVAASAPPAVAITPRRCCLRRAARARDHSAPGRTGTSRFSSRSTRRSSSSTPIHPPPSTNDPNSRRRVLSALLLWLLTVPQLTPISSAISASDNPS